MQCLEKFTLVGIKPSRIVAFAKTYGFITNKGEKKLREDINKIIVEASTSNRIANIEPMQTADVSTVLSKMILQMVVYAMKRDETPLQISLSLELKVLIPESAISNIEKFFDAGCSIVEEVWPEYNKKKTGVSYIFTRE